MSIDLDESEVKSCTRLGKKRKEKDNTEPQTRMLRSTHEFIDDADVLKKSLGELKYAKTELRNLRISHNRSLREKKLSNFLYKEQKT